MERFRLRNVSLRAQLVLMFMVAFALFQALSLVLNLITVESGAGRQARQELNEAMDFRQKTLEEWMQHHSSFVESLASISYVKKQSNYFAIDMSLKAVGKLNTGFTALRLLDRNGQLVASSENGTDGALLQNVFYSAAENKTRLISGYIAWEPEGRKGLVFASPVYEETDFKGMVAGFVPESDLAALLQAYSFGSTGRVLLMDRQGELLPAGSSLSEWSALQGTDRFLSARQQEGIAQSRDPLEVGKVRYTITRPILEGRFLLIGQIERDEFRQPIEKMAGGMLWTSFLFFAIGLCILLTFAGRMGKTLKEMADSAVQVAGGNLNHRMSLSKSRFHSVETEAICEAFNRMTEALNRQVGELTQMSVQYQESEERYRSMIEQSPDGILIHAFDEIILMNDVACRLLGAPSPDAFIGRKVLTLVPEDMQDTILQRLQDLRTPGCVMPPEYRQYVRLDGTLLEAESSACCILLNGQPSVMVMFRDISERRMIQRALEESEERHRFIAENSTDMIARIGPDLRHRYTSQACTHLLGYEPEELLGRSVLELIDETFHPEILAMKEQMSSSVCQPDACDEIVTLRFRFSRKDGSKVWLETTARPVRDAFGQVQEVVAVSRDVTDRIRMEEELLDRSSRISNILSSITDAFFALDGEWRFTYINETAERLLKVPKASMIGVSVWEAIPQIQGTAVETAFRRAVREMTSSVLEMRFPSVDAWYEIRVYPAKAGLSVYVSDITTRRVLEQKLQALSTMDGLTGIANRRHFNEVLLREWKRGARDRSPLSIIMLDVDFFKSYNDTYGHQAGDECLKEVAAALYEAVGQDRDKAFRYGGEEFALILPNLGAEESAYLAEEIRQAMEQRRIPHQGSPIGAVTLSLGVSTLYPEARQDPKLLVAQADAALYRSKQDGRNVVSVSQGTRIFPEK